MIKCNKCGTEKEGSEFYPRNKVCKECTKKRVSDYQKTDIGREVHRNANKRYSQTDKCKENRKKAEEKYNQHPETHKKKLAKWAVKRAVKVGILTRGCCEKCGSSENIHGHHCDYDKQLDVMWLCARCHNEWHRINGEGLNSH